MERTTIREKYAMEPARGEEIEAEATTQEELIAVVAGEGQTCLQQAKAHFRTGHYTEALEKLEAFLKIAPGNIETRVWIRMAKTELTKV